MSLVKGAVWEQLDPEQDHEIVLNDGRKLTAFLPLPFNLYFTHTQVQLTLAKTTRGEYLIFPCSKSEVGTTLVGIVLTEPISLVGWQKLIQSVLKATNELADLELGIERLVQDEDLAKTVEDANRCKFARLDLEDELDRICGRDIIVGKYSLQPILNFLDVFLSPKTTTAELERLLNFVNEVLKEFLKATQQGIEA